MNVWELSQEIEQFYRERRKILESKAGAGVQWGLLRKMLLQHFDELSVRALAVDYGVRPEVIEDSSFMTVILDVIEHTHRSGQWEILRSRLELERPSVPWADSVSPFSSLLPLRQEVLVNQPNELQAALLLDHHFSILESGSIISRIDQTIDWGHPPYSVRKPQLTAVFIVYLAGVQKVPQLVSLMKELRPHVPAIQQFSWEEPDNPFPRKSPDDLFLEVKASPVQRTPSSFPSLEAQLLQNFSLDELDEMCFEAGIEYDRFGAWILQERVTYIAKFLERIDGDPMGKAFIAGCASRVPTFDWAEAVGLDKESIPPIDSVTTNGFYLSRLRSLLEQCLPDNSHIFDFVQAHFPETRRNLSANWPPKKNRVELAGTLKRGAKLHHLFNVLEKEHPQQYLLFAPYSE